MDLLFGFSGRIGRLQWWLGQLAMVAISIVSVFVIYSGQGLAGLEAVQDGSLERLSAGMVATLAIVTLLTTWIGLAVSIKRFHDRDKSGFWILIILVPIIGPLWQFIECGFLSGTDGTNRYGDRGGRGSSMSRADSLDSRAYSISAAEQPRTISASTVMPQPAGRFARQAASGFGRRGR
jgi:uncharacterized membrane protein YhaH (DUF805 family)